MTYAKGSLISAADYNTFSTNVNAIWGVGTGNSGYGCTNTVGTATTAVLIGSSEWTTLLARGNSTALHQGTTWSSGTSQTSQSHINVISTLSSDITSLSTNKNNTDAANLTTTPGIISTTNSSSWTTTKTYTFTVDFTGSNTAQDAARAYFNAGGKIQVSYSHTGGTGTKATDWDTLCTACGTTIFAYGSTTKSGGSGSTNILATTTGYFAPLSVSPTYTDLFKQFSAGSNYTANDVVVSIKGDGHYANAFAVLNTASNTVSSIIIDNLGYGYTYADISLTSSRGSGATARAVISPPGGHGSNPLTELGGSYLIFNIQLKDSEGRILTTHNDYRQIALVEDPHLYGTTNKAATTTVSQLTVLTLNGTSVEYSEDEWVFQGASYASSFFKGIVVDWDSTNNVIKLAQTEGVPTKDLLVGANTTAARFVSSITPPTLQPRTGNLLYTDNIVAIQRADDQAEDYRIVFKF